MTAGELRVDVLPARFCDMRSYKDDELLGCVVVS